MMSKIDHIAIKSLDIARDSAWYAQEFGLKIAYQDSTWALLESGTCSLALVTPGQHPAHFAFLAGGDAPPEAKSHRDGTRSKYIKDPSGNVVELLWR